MPDENLSDLNIVRLALGGIFALMTADELKPDEYARASENPQIKKRAEQIVLRELARLAGGGHVDEDMQWLLGVWCRQRMQGKDSGRPDAYVKETAVCVAFYEATHKHPNRQRKAIYADLMKQFELKRSRLLEILQKAGPRRRRHRRSSG